MVIIQLCKAHYVCFVSHHFRSYSVCARMCVCTRVCWIQWCATIFLNRQYTIHTWSSMDLFFVSYIMFPFGCGIII